MLKKQLAMFSGKTLGKLSRMLGHQGTTLPGVVALKMDPRILQKMAKQITQFIFITGTNGKTTTSNLLTHLLRSAGLKILNNAEGANMITGITACFINQAPLFGKLKYDYAVLEVDEATMPVILKQVSPKMIIVTNFFRDQLDRYGEIDMLIKDLEKSIHPIDTKLILNADDPFVFRLNALDKSKTFYGLHKGAYPFGNYGTSESKYCSVCGDEIQYDHIHFNQLGFYHCACGFKRPTPHYEIESIHSTPLTFTLQNETYHTKMTGAYNAYNALAAIACAKELGVEPDYIRESLQSYHTENGRMQLFYHKGYPYILNLNKNPSGTNAALTEILLTDYQKQIVFVINDFIADGLDVSWIWDVDFECLQRLDMTRIICSGSRAADIALRLKYAGIDESRIIIEPAIQAAIQTAFKYPMPTYLLPTYTALEQVKNELNRGVNQAYEASSL